MDEKPGDVLTIEELSAYLKIPKSTLYKLVREGKVPCQKIGRHWRFRKEAIERIGLPQVRNHRLSLLEQEEERFREQLERRAQILPEMAPLLLVRVEGGAHG